MTDTEWSTKTLKLTQQHMCAECSHVLSVYTDKQSCTNINIGINITINVGTYISDIKSWQKV